ncbi:hypothetical protein RFI_13562, partial [Reticulomyxa filosa]
MDLFAYFFENRFCHSKIMYAFVIPIENLYNCHVKNTDCFIYLQHLSCFKNFKTNLNISMGGCASDNAKDGTRSAETAGISSVENNSDLVEVRDPTSGNNICERTEKISLRFEKHHRRPIFVSLYHLNESFEQIPPKVLKIALFAFLLPRRWVFMIGEDWTKDTIYTANLKLKPELRRLIYEKDMENMVLWIHPRFDRSSNDYKQGKSGWSEANIKLGKTKDLTNNCSQPQQSIPHRFVWANTNHSSLNPVVLNEESFLEQYQRFRDSW